MSFHTWLVVGELQTVNNNNNIILLSTYDIVFKMLASHDVIVAIYGLTGGRRKREKIEKKKSTHTKNEEKTILSRSVIRTLGAARGVGKIQHVKAGIQDERNIICCRNSPGEFFCPTSPKHFTLNV